MNSRTLLFTAVSVFALIAASPEVRGADVLSGVVAKARPADPGRCEWWGEGGASWTGGQDVHFGLPAVDAGKVKTGYEAAIGFDCRWGTSPWHVSAQVRYGEAQRSGGFNAPGVFSIRGGAAHPGSSSIYVPFAANGAGTFTQREQHGLADFAVGRDVGLGVGQSQLKLGLRIAEIQARTSGNGQFNVPFTPLGTPPIVPNPFAFVQNSHFIGGGPRLGIDGSVPLGSGWSFDYLAGIAGLIGSRSLDVNGSGAAVNAGIANFGASDFTGVLNLDAQAGLSYWFTPNLKMTASYRFDGYWGALKTFNAAGAVVNEDRFYGGPMLRITGFTDGPSLPAVAPALFVKAPVAVSTWTVWAEGGAFNTGGGSVHVGDPIDAGKPNWGREGAIGFDYRIGASPWHLSADVRYGSAGKSGSFARNGTVFIPSHTVGGPPSTLIPAAVGANGTFTQREQHGVADFSVGRDVGLGTGAAQWKAGLRIAEIASRTTGSANFVAPQSFIPSLSPSFIGAVPGAFSFDQRSHFVGGGPRGGLEGTVPIGRGFGIDYLGGAAVLFGVRSLTVSTGGAAAAFGINNLGLSDTVAVFNLEGEAGLSYRFSQSLKLTAGYRFDGYWGALKTIDAQGIPANVDRFYAGPVLRMTGTF